LNRPLPCETISQHLETIQVRIDLPGTATM